MRYLILQVLLLLLSSIDKQKQMLIQERKKQLANKYQADAALDAADKNREKIRKTSKV